MTGNSAWRRLRLLSWAAVAAALLAPCVARADVTGEGDVSPLGPTDLPLDGGIVDGDIIVGGTLAPPLGTIPVGRLVVDVPAFTEPLVSNNGFIGNTIGSVGEATITGFFSEWQLNDTLVVGRLGQGYLNVTGTAFVTTAVLVPGAENPGDDDFDFIVGEFEGSQGFVTVDGFASTLRNDNLSVGHRGQGRIDMTNRAVMTTRIEASVGSVLDLTGGDDAIGAGYVLLDGRGTRWNIGIDAAIAPGNPAPDTFDGVLYVGREGRGTVEIRNQAIVVVETDTILGELVDSFGKVIVTGTGSQLLTREDLFVGNAAGTSVGELHLGPLGEARTIGNGANGGTFVGALGLVEMTGGTLFSPNVTNNGLIRGYGRVESAAVVNNGEIRNSVVANQLRERLLLTGAVANTANIESIGGELEFLGAVTNAGPDAQVVAIDAILRFGGGVINSDGARIFLENTLIFVPAGQSFASAGTLSLWAGESTLVGDLELASSNLLNVELGNPYSRLEVVGDASLGGSVNISLADDYLPQIGDSFEIIDAQSRAGTFATVGGGGTGAGFWQASYTASSAILSYVSDLANTLMSDFDRNGFVDGADLAILRMNFGLAPATQADGDANGDGQVDGFDLLVFQRQLGTFPPVVPAGNANAGTVPEPSTLALAAAGLLALLCRRRAAA